MKPFLSLIFACDHNGVIGIDGKLPWYYPEDLRFFRKATSGRAVIMGRKTWESLPIKPLADRLNIVVSKSSHSYLGAKVVKSLEEALEYAKTEGFPDAMVIGGKSLLEEAALYAHMVIISYIKNPVPADKVLTAKEVTRFDFTALAKAAEQNLATWVLTMHEELSEDVYVTVLQKRRDETEH